MPSAEVLGLQLFTAALPHAHHLPRLNRAQRFEARRHMREQHFNLVGLRTNNDQRNMETFEILLVWNALIHCKQHVVTSCFCQPQKVTIRLTGQSSSYHAFTFMTNKMSAHFPRHTFVDQDFHLMT